MTKNIGIVIGMIAMAAGGFLLYQQVANDNAATPPASLPVASETVASKAVASDPVAGIEFTLADLDGQPRNFSEWDGKARIVNFWATWCAPCRREIPLLKKTQAEHGANNLQIIGVAVDFVEDVAAYAEDTQFNYPILVGQEDAMAAAEASGVEMIGMPFTLIVSPDGELLNAHMGEIVEAHIETIIGVFQRMESGELSADAARAELATM